jgi:diguanylate cyclase
MSTTATAGVDRSVRAVLVIGIVAAVVSVLSLLVSSEITTENPWLIAIHAVAVGTPAVSALLAAIRQPQQRRRWAVLAGALALSLAGGVVYLYVDRRFGVFGEFGSADGFYLASYSLLLAAGAWPPRRQRELATTIDGLIAGAALATVTVLGLQWLLTGALGEERAGDLALTYFAFDITAAALTITIATQYRLLARRRLMMAAGFLLLGASDMIYALNALGATGRQTGLSQGAYVLGSCLLGISPWILDRQRSSAVDDVHPAQYRLSGAVLPTVGSIVGLVVLVGAAFQRSSGLLSWLAVACVVLSIARTMVAMRNLATSAEHRHQARTDDLTGIPNRRAFLEGLDLALGARTHDESMAVCLVDLDAFKDVNDTLGHGAGDEVLQIMARRFVEIRSIEGVARLGGDEFGFFVRAAATDVEAIVEHVAQRIAEPILLRGLRVHVESSTGIALVDADVEVDELIRRADVAMYRAKRDDARVQMYSRSIDRGDRDRLQLLDDLRTALTDDQITVALQPIVEIATGKIVAVETLVRWNHPRLGELWPSSFLRLAEQGGLLDQLTQVVLGRVSDAHARLTRGGHLVDIQINIEPTQLTEPTWVATTHAFLMARGVDARRMIFEITESSWASATHDPSVAARELRELGYRIAIDDFGVGESSLHRLVTLPVDQLKIDQSFAEMLATNERARSVVGGLLTLARTLGLQLVAEGVESATVADTLHGLGCEFVQGFAIAVPCSIDELLDILEQRRTTDSPAQP